MKDFILTIFKGIVDNPEEVVIEIGEPDAAGVTLYKVHVAQSDMGRVIGRNGRVVKSIKNLFKSYAAHIGESAILEVE